MARGAAQAEQGAIRAEQHAESIEQGGINKVIMQEASQTEQLRASQVPKAFKNAQAKEQALINQDYDSMTAKEMATKVEE